MKLIILIATATLISSVIGTEAEPVQTEFKASIPMQHRSNEPLNPHHDTMARIQSKKQQISANPIYSVRPNVPVQHEQVAAYPTAYQHVGIGAAPASSFQQTGPLNPLPGGAYHHIYQQQQAAGSPIYQRQSAVFSHPKEASKLKKTVPQILKEVKPSYYPKESTYATVPAQPNEAVVTRPTSNTARFVADPSRNHLIEEISENQLQQLTYRPQQQIYSAAPHHGVPAYTNFVNPAGGPMPYGSQYQSPHMETATVTYEQTEHGFMERVWGEVESMRESISTDIFGAIPAFFRNIWDTIVGAVSSASARMLSVDWVTVMDIARKQLQ